MSVPDRMTAAVLREPGDFELTEVPVPEPDPDELLVRIRACGICGSDLKIRDRGWLQEGTEYPLIPGHEWTGEVVETGERATDFEIGDRVADETHAGCGHCRNCKTGLYTACLNYGRTEKGHRHYGFTVDGGYATYCAIAERNLHRLPPEVSFRDGTLTTVLGTSLYGVEKASVRAGDTVLVIGPGPTGLTAVVAARLRGARRVIVTGTRESRLEVAEELGADHTVDVTERDPGTVVDDLTDGVGVDVVIEAAGTHATVRESIELVRSGGRVGLIGNPGEGESPIPTQRIVNRDLDVHGVKAQGRNAAERAVAALARDDVDVDPIFTHEYPFEDLLEAMETFETRSGGAIKVVVRM